MATKDAKKKQTKRPTALKRDLQSQKRRLRNKAYKSTVKTAIRSFHETLEKGDQEAVKLQLNEVYSILDKCVKKGVYKLNKAGRTKSSLAVKLQPQA